LGDEKIAAYMQKEYNVDLELLTCNAISTKEYLDVGREIHRTYSKIPSILENKIRTNDIDLFYSYAIDVQKAILKDLRNNNLDATMQYQKEFTLDETTEKSYASLGESCYFLAELLYTLDSAINQKKNKKKSKDIKSFAKTLSKYNSKLDNIEMRIS